MMTEHKLELEAECGELISEHYEALMYWGNDMFQRGKLNGTVRGIAYGAAIVMAAQVLTMCVMHWHDARIANK